MLGLGEEFHRPVERGKHAAAVYVADQDDRGIDRLGESHIHNVVGAEVNLRRGTRALNHNDILLGREAMIGLQHFGEQSLLLFLIFDCTVVPDRFSAEHQLRARVRVRL